MVPTLSTSAPISGQAASLDAAIDTARVVADLPRLKAEVDGAMLDQFRANGTSALQLSKDLTGNYQSLLRDAADRSGLSSALRDQGFVLAALGGFARGQSAIHSDWDAALIHRDPNAKLSHPSLINFVDLMSKGIEIKFALRSPDWLDTALSGKNTQPIISLTALLTIEILSGDQSAVTELESARDTLIQRQFPRIVAMLTESIREREQKKGTLFKLAEFDLKDARGGLRDLDCIAWLDQMARIAGHEPIIDQSEREIIANAREILLTAKHALHFSHTAGSRGNVNQWSNDRRANLLEIFKRSAGDLLPPRVVYETIYSASQQTAAILNRMIERCNHSGHQESPLTHSPRQATARDSEIVESVQLGSLLQQGAASVPQLRTLFESGRLTQIIPEFGYSEFFVDNAGFHLFPLGEHHVRATEELVRLLDKVENGTLAELRIQRPKDTAPLTLATLLHDISKPDEGLARDHPARGAEIAFAVAERLGFSPDQAEKTRRLVADHMIIADIAGRSEFALVAADAANRIHDLEYLQELLLLTLADKKESNPLNWNASRRDQLLGAYQQLKIALGDPREYRNNLCEAVHDLLSEQGAAIERAEIREFVDEIAPDVLGFYSPLILAEKIRLLSEVKARPENGEAPFRVKLILPEPTDARLQLFFVCPDSDGLLARVSSFLSQRSMALRSALVDTRGELACDYLSIQIPSKLQLNQDDLDRFVIYLNRAITGTISAPKYSLTAPQSTWETEAFANLLNVQVKPAVRDSHLSLTIVDRRGREVFPIIAPTLERHQVSVVNAQIGCGNRGVRHYLELQPRGTGPIDAALLKSEIEDAYRA